MSVWATAIKCAHSMKKNSMLLLHIINFHYYIIINHWQNTCVWLRISGNIYPKNDKKMVNNIQLPYPKDDNPNQESKQKQIKTEDGRHYKTAKKDKSCSLALPLFVERLLLSTIVVNLKHVIFDCQNNWLQCKQTSFSFCSPLPELQLFTVDCHFNSSWLQLINAKLRQDENCLIFYKI